MALYKHVNSSGAVAAWRGMARSGRRANNSRAHVYHGSNGVAAYQQYQQHQRSMS